LCRWRIENRNQNFRDSGLGKTMKKRKTPDFIECDECGEIFVIDEPFCPYCGKSTEEIIKAMEKKQKA